MTATGYQCRTCKHFGKMSVKCHGCTPQTRLNWEPKEPMTDIVKATEAKHDAGKIRPTLLPVTALERVAEVREYGCRKYGDPENWRKAEPQRYLDALMRHLWAHDVWTGPRTPPLRFVHSADNVPGE